MNRSERRRLERAGVELPKRATPADAKRLIDEAFTDRISWTAARVLLERVTNGLQMRPGDVVHAATGRWLSDREADDLARSVVRSGVDLELAAAEVSRLFATSPDDLARVAAGIRALADGTATA